MKFVIYSYLLTYAHATLRWEKKEQDTMYIVNDSYNDQLLLIVMPTFIKHILA